MSMSMSPLSAILLRARQKGNPCPYFVWFVNPARPAYLPTEQAGHVKEEWVAKNSYSVDSCAACSHVCKVMELHVPIQLSHQARNIPRKSRWWIDIAAPRVLPDKD